MANLPLLFLRVVILAVLEEVVYSVTSNCFYPGRNPAPNDKPCGDGISSCCNDSAICLENGLCLETQNPYVLSRGSCTDRSWESPQCPQYCKDVLPDSGCAVVLYNFFISTQNQGESTYCCDALAANSSSIQLACAHNERPFEIVNGAMIPGRAALADLTEKAYNNASTGAPVETRHSSTSVVAVGVGVGVPLGVIAAVFVAWACWERSGRKKMVVSGVHAVDKPHPSYLSESISTTCRG